MGGGSSKPATSRGVQPNAQAVPPFKIVLRNCTGLAKTDSNGLTDCYIVGRFYDLKTEKFLPKTFKSTVREKTLEPEFDEVYIVTDLPGLHFRVDLECWDADQVGKDDFLGMHRIYLGQYDHDFQKYVPHRRDFANIPYTRTVKLQGKVGELRKNVQGEFTYEITRERVDDCHFVS